MVTGRAGGVGKGQHRLQKIFQQTIEKRDWGLLLPAHRICGFCVIEKSLQK